MTPSEQIDKLIATHADWRGAVRSLEFAEGDTVPEAGLRDLVRRAIAHNAERRTKP